MHKKVCVRVAVLMLINTSLLLSACGTSNSTSPTTSSIERPEWFNLELTDVQTGEIFTMNDYAGKVALVETMAIWCPNCIAH